MMLPRECQWKYAGRADWPGERLDAPADWLRSGELAELARLRDANRRQQWLAGRWIGKQLVGETYGVGAEEVQILTRDEQQRSVRPRIYVDDQQIECSLSLSHSEGGVLAVLATADGLSVGVDLVGGVPCNSGFQQLWFTARERRWLQQDTQRRTALLWGLKEAVYKACNTGESWTPKSIEMLPQADGSFRCFYRGNLFSGFASHAWDLEGQLAVVVSVPRVLAIATSAEVYTSLLASREEAVASCS